MRKYKAGALNPMFNKEKSKEFIAHVNKDRSGSNNPMFVRSTKKSEETLAKLRKKVYVYDSCKQFVRCYDSVGSVVKDLHMGAGKSIWIRINFLKINSFIQNYNNFFSL